jgi:hypothetical protein
VELGGSYQVIWDSKNGRFSSAETWDKLRVKYPIVDWYNIVWFASAIPRHSFFLWLAFHKAISPREKMCGWGFEGDSLFLFCRASIESQSHLFFECSFSRRIWSSLMNDCSVSYYPSKWDEVAIWSITAMKGSTLESSIWKLCFGAAVYHLWLQRNALIHEITPRTEEQIISRIRWEVRSRVMAKFSARTDVHRF